MYTNKSLVLLDHHYTRKIQPGYGPQPASHSAGTLRLKCRGIKLTNHRRLRVRVAIPHPRSLPSGGAQRHDFNDNRNRNLIMFHLKWIFVGYPWKIVAV